MCGIIGIVSRSRQVASDMYYGLYGLQHRGKESAGMVTSECGEKCCFQGEMGEIPIVFSKKILERLSGNVGIAQNRYSTTSESSFENIQPIQGYWGGEEFWIAHNGNLINTEDLREYCLNKGRQPSADSDTAAIASLISLTSAFSFEQAVKKTIQKLRGAFSLVILYKDRIIVVRDSLGIRPLCLGKRKDGYIVASETCALHHMGATLIREIDPGEISVINRAGIKKYYHPSVTARKFCIFELIYFSRPDSIVLGRRVGDVQENMGRLLAQEHPAEADIVIPIPDSGNYGGWGFIEVSKIPNGQKAILRTHLISRTFIEAVQELRDQGVDLKFVILKEKVMGKRVVLIDDSVVRGTTQKRLVKWLRAAGAKEIHARIFSPPYMYPCYYGIDTYRVKDELIAKRNKGDIEKIRQELGLDSLEYLSLDLAIKAIIETPCVRKPCISLKPDNFCAACFNSRYPVKPSKIN